MSDINVLTWIQWLYQLCQFLQYPLLIHQNSENAFQQYMIYCQEVQNRHLQQAYAEAIQREHMIAVISANVQQHTQTSNILREINNIT